MSKKRYKRTKKKQLNKRKVSLVVLIIILIIITCIYNSIKKDNQSTETATYSQANKIDKCIVIDAGHGGEEEPGCIFGNVYEKNICLQIAKKLQDVLSDVYSEVIMTRTEDVNVYLNERARIANRANADIFVSIHQNALENDTVTNGIETWYNPKKDSVSKILAQNIQDNVIKETNAEDLGIKESTGLIVTKNTEMASCLVETGFLSSTMERQKLVSDLYQDKIVQGIFNGIKSYFDEIDSLKKDSTILPSNNV